MTTALWEQLLAEERELQFDRFSLDDAWQLGSRLRADAAAQGLPVAIGVWLAGQRAFATGLPGSSAENDLWLERKLRVTMLFGRASLTVGEKFRLEGHDFDADARLDPREYAAHGGVVPIRIRDSAVIGAVGVSGLEQHRDHALVVGHLRAYLAEQGR